MTSAHPVVRLPVFLMGVLAAIQVLRENRYHGVEFKDPNLLKNILHTLIPWGCGFQCCKTKQDETSANQNCDEEKKLKIWKTRVDFNAFLYVGFLMCLTLIKLALDLSYGPTGGNVCLFIKQFYSM